MKRGLKKALLSVVFCLLIVGVGAGMVAGAVILRGMRRAAQPAQAQAERLTNVKVQILEPVTIQDTVQLSGGVEPWEDVTLSAETAGKIEWLGVEEGDRVVEKQELVKIDTVAIRAKLDQAVARHRLAGQELERQQGMSKEGITSPQALDRAVADRAVAAADLRATRILLDKSEVYAELDGIVDTVFKERGEYIEVGKALVRIVQVDRVKVNVGLPERDTPLINKGDAVEVTLDAFPGRTFNGTLFRIATTAEPTTRTFIAEIQIDNPDGLLRPGMIARAKLVRRTFIDALVIPIFAVITLDDQRFVFVEEGGVARVRPVEIGVFQGASVQVVAGLEAGDRLIVVGQRDLLDGERIIVEEVVE